MPRPRCYYADKSRRPAGSPVCAPGTLATHVVRRIRFFWTSLYLCRAHANYHAELNPQPLKEDNQ